MASPFRYNKKERRRWRKAARRTDGVANLEETKPEIAASLKRIAKTYAGIAASKRRKKKP
jgi:hypothetical protein